MDNFKDIRNNINHNCNKAISIADDILNDNSIHVIIKKMTEQIKERVNDINQLCEVEKYNLYFNGKVAIGKSTTICNLFGLVDKSKLIKESKLNSLSLLKTGSGRTTVCETRIIPHSESSKIVVTPVSIEDFSVYVQEFCKWVNGDASDFSLEEGRIIKNMIDIPSKYTSSEEIKNYLVESYGDLEDVHELNTIFMETINYLNRNNTMFDLKNATNNDFINWLKKTYEGINDGTINNCPMPKNISIYISDLDSNLELPVWIESIVDTRGIDGGERSDLQKYLNYKNSISFMCDEIDAFGGNESIISILKQNLIKENRDTKFRTILLGLEKDNELENISEAEEDRIKGIKIKSSQALKKMRDNNIYFNKKNLMFVETVPGAIVSQKKLIEIDNDLRNKRTQEFFDNIYNIINRMYKEYSEEIYDCLKTLTQLSNGKISVETINKFKQCQEYILKGKTKVEEKTTTILQRIEDSTLSIYHSSLMGAVNHNGIGKTADLYASFQKCGGEEFKDHCLEEKSNIIALIENLFQNCNEMESICFRAIIDEIDKSYLNFYNESRTQHSQITFNNLYNNDSWRLQKTYWGDGKGNYNRRVTNDLINEIKKKCIDTALQNLRLEIRFFDTVFSFLNIT